MLKFLKKVIKFFIWLFIILALAIAGGTYFYGDKIKALAINELNEYVVGDIYVGSLDFTLIDNFPAASLQFNNVVAMSSNTFNKKDFAWNTDTLLVAQSIYLQFDILELIEENYEVHAVRVDNAIVNVYHDKDGKDNYQLFKQSEDSVQQDVSVKIDQVELNDVKLAYCNAGSDFLIQTFISDFEMNGAFVANDFDAKIATDAHIYLCRQKNKELVSRKDLSADIAINVYKDNYTIKSATLEVDEQEFECAGEVKDTKFGFFANVDFSANGIDIDRTIALIPYHLGDEFYNLGLKGRTSLEGTVAGYFNEKEELSVDVKFSELDASFAYEGGQNRVLSRGMFSAENVYKAKTYRLQTDTVIFKRGKSAFYGKARIKDFDLLKTNMVGDIDGNLADMNAFLPEKGMQKMAGTMKGRLSFAGDLSELSELNKDKLLLTKLYLSATLDNVQFYDSKQNLSVTGLYGDVNCTNKDIKIDSAQLVYNGVPVKTTAKLVNGLPYFLLDNEELIVGADVETGYVDVDKVFPSSESESGAGSADLFPEKISARINLINKGFKYDNFEASLIKGQFTYSNKRLYTKNLVINGVGGQITGDFDLEPIWGGGYRTKGDVSLKKIDMNKLLYSFNSFGQEFITDKNLEGLLTAKVKFTALWDKSFEVDLKSIFADCDLEVTDGSLNDFKPLEDLSSFVKLEELKSVKFDTLKNHIIIKDEVITIPQMDINSSLYNMTIEGSQKFDASFEYVLRLSLTEIMAKKFKRNKREKENFGEIEDDGLGNTNIFLTIKGNPDDFTIAYNTKKVKEIVVESIKKEAQTIKNILRSEFRRKKKDTVPEAKFRVVEDEEQVGDWGVDFE